MLYYDDDQNYSDNGGSFIVSISTLTNNVTVWATNGDGVAVGTVTNGVTYTYFATGSCSYNTNATDSYFGPDGGGSDVCIHFYMGNAVCPNGECFSLVGKIR